MKIINKTVYKNKWFQEINKKYKNEKKNYYVLNIPDNEKIFSLIGSVKEMGQTEIYFSYVNINDDETSFGEGLTIIFKTLFHKVESFIKYYSSNFEIPYVNVSGSLSPGESGPSFSGHTDLDGEFSVELVEVELNDIGYDIREEHIYIYIRI